MQIATDVISEYTGNSGLKRFVFFLRLKLEHERGFIKDYRLKTLSEQFNTPKSTVSRYLRVLKNEGLITVSFNGHLLLKCLNKKDNGDRKMISTVRIHSKMSNRQIITQLLGKIIRKKVRNIKFIRDLKSDHAQVINSSHAESKMFGSIDALLRVNKKYVDSKGISRTVGNELKLSDTKAAKLFNVTREYFNRSIKPLISSRCGITIETVKERLPLGADMHENDPRATFFQKGRAWNVYTRYTVSGNKEASLNNPPKKATPKKKTIKKSPSFRLYPFNGYRFHKLFFKKKRV